MSISPNPNPQPQAQAAAPDPTSAYYDAITSALSNLGTQGATQATAASNAAIAANNQALQAQYAQQAADYGLQQQTAINNSQYQVGQLQPKIADIQSQHALTQADLQQNAIWTDAAHMNTMAGRGVGLSGIALGVAGRDQAALGQKLGQNDLTSATAQDAVSRAITGLQQNAANTVAGLQARQTQLSGLAGAAPSAAAAGGAALSAGGAA